MGFHGHFLKDFGVKKGQKWGGPKMTKNRHFCPKLQKVSKKIEKNAKK